MNEKVEALEYLRTDTTIDSIERNYTIKMTGRQPYRNCIHTDTRRWHFKSQDTRKPCMKLEGSDESLLPQLLKKWKESLEYRCAENTTIHRWNAHHPSRMANDGKCKVGVCALPWTTSLLRHWSLETRTRCMTPPSVRLEYRCAESMLLIHHIYPSV